MSPKAASRESASPLGCRPIAQGRPPRQHAYDAAGRAGVHRAFRSAGRPGPDRGEARAQAKAARRWEINNLSPISPIATFTYDAVGNRLTMADGTGVTTYSHNPANAPEAVTYPGAKIITYAYDEVGNRATLADPDGGLTTYSYDAANRIEWLANPFAERTTFVHDVTGRPITQLNANGTWVSCSYDDAGRLTVLANLKSDNTTISSFLYSLDNVGNRTGVQEAGGDLVTWSYDNAYQLTREQRSGANAYDITYTYDPVGNRVIKIEGGATTTYSYDAANQIETEETPSQITTFTFDANGNTQVENAAGSLTTYTWNVDNMCVGIALPSGALNTFAYDADLKRRQAQDSAGLAKFINDLDNVLAETDGGGTTQVAYALDPQTYGNLIAQRRSGSTAWHLFDALGSTERLTGSDQAALSTYLNTAFGVPKVATGNHPNRLRWVGRLGYRWEPDRGEYHVRRRLYDPARAVWRAVDPVLAQRSASGHRYVVNNPVNRIDPSGLKCQATKMWMESKGPGRCHAEGEPWASIYKGETLGYVWKASPWPGSRSARYQIWVFQCAGTRGFWVQVLCPCKPEEWPYTMSGGRKESKMHYYQVVQKYTIFKNRYTEPPTTEKDDPWPYYTGPWHQYRKCPPKPTATDKSEYRSYTQDTPICLPRFVVDPRDLGDLVKHYPPPEPAGEPPLIGYRRFRMGFGYTETSIEQVIVWGYRLTASGHGPTFKWNWSWFRD